MEPWIHELPYKIIVEDSNSQPELFNRLRTLDFRIIINGRRLGQLPSIDRAYEQLKTEFIFHCEDDWEFSRRPNMEAARQILKEGIDDEGKFSVVCFRETTGTKHSRKGLFRDRTVQGSLFRYSFDHKYPFNYFSFNPGMLRRDFYERYGPWSKFKNERSIAQAIMRERRCIARELPGIVRHIGKGRSRVRPSKWKWIRELAKNWLVSKI